MNTRPVPVTIEAAGRGGPWVNLTDGRPVPIEFPAGSHWSPS